MPNIIRVERSEQNQVSIYTWNGSAYKINSVFQSGQGVLCFFNDPNGTPVGVTVTDIVKTVTLFPSTVTDTVVLPDVPINFVGDVYDLMTLLRDDFFFLVSGGVSALTDGEGTSVGIDGTSVNLGDGNRATASRICKGDALNTFDLTFQEYRILSGLCTQIGWTGINAAWLRANSGFTQVSGGLGILMGTKKVNNLTVKKNAPLKIIDTSNGECEFIQEEYVQEDDQFNNTPTYANIDDLAFSGVANGIYKVEGVIIFESDNINNGIGVSFNTLPAGATCTMTYFAPVTGGGYTVGEASNNVGGHSATSAVPATGKPIVLTFSAVVRFAATAGVFNTTFKSFDFGGAGAWTITLKTDSSMTVKKLN